MLSWLPSTTYLIGGGIVALIVLGFGMTVGVAVMRGMLWCLQLSSRLLSRAWHWLTGTPPSSWGTAHLATEAEIARKGLFTRGGIPLGTWQGKPLFEASGGHVAIIAPPRSWKSRSFVGPAVAGYAGSVLVNDPRAELFAMTHRAREDRGPTYRFNPTGQESCALNVVDAVRWGEPEAYGDVQRLVHGVLSPDVGEPWNDFRLEATPLLEAILHDRHAAGEGHLPAVVQWMTEPSRSMKQKAEALLRSPLPIVSAGGRRLLDKSDRLAAAVWSAALSSLSLYQDPLVASNTDHSDVSLGDLQHGTQPVSLFLTPPFADVARLRPLLGTLTEMLVGRFSAQQDAARQKVALFLDEMANLGTLRELERGQSYLQGSGVQIIQTWQNVLQVRQTYGKDSPILASVATQVLYTPSDYETADYLSKELGVSTERLHPETHTLTFWGLLSSRSIGTSEHARPLLLPDECRRLDESAAVMLVKGVAPILGTKLGIRAPEVIDLTTRRLKRVAMVAGALILAGSMGTWALWSRPESPAPRLAMTTVAPNPREEGGAGALHQAPGMPDDPPTIRIGTEEEKRLALGLMDRLTIQEPQRWQLFHTVTPAPWGKGPYSTPELLSGAFATAEACEASRQHKLAMLHQMVASQPPGQVSMRRLDDGFEQTLGKTVRRETWRCLLMEDGPS